MDIKKYTYYQFKLSSPEFYHIFVVVLFIGAKEVTNNNLRVETTTQQQTASNLETCILIYHMRYNTIGWGSKYPVIIEECVDQRQEKSGKT